MTSQNQLTRRESPSAAPTTTPEPTSTATGDLVRGAADQGFEAQEAMLRPDAASALNAGRLDEALRYNRKSGGKPTFVTQVQSFIGVAATGKYDAPTVQAVAGYQGPAGLTVDGKVGPETRAKLVSEGVTAPQAAPRPEPQIEPQTEAGGTPELAEPAPTVEEAPAAETTVAPDTGEVAEVSTTAPPLSFGEGTTLSIAALVTWAQAAATTTDAGLAQLAAMDPSDATAQSLSASLTREAAALEAAGDALRTRAIQLINDASLLRRPAAQPTLPTRPELLALGDALRRIGRAGGAMSGATAVCLDAVLAIQQGASVLSARATWGQAPREARGGTEIAAQRAAADDPLNAIFRDSGFASRIATTTNSEGEEKIHDWCGMFVGSSLFRGGGLDEELRAGMLHTSNVLDYFQYMQKANAARAPKSIWAEGQWHDLRTYHGGRGSVRQWQSRATVTSVMEGGGPLDVRPGDVVLVDHRGNSAAPQHITMVESYDPSTHQLVTIEGNTSGIRPASDGQVGDAGDGYHEVNATGRDGSGLHTRDMTNMSAGSRATHADAHAANMERHRNTPQGAYRGSKGTTVFGIGRPSAVDFEEHEYATKVVPEALKHISPAEMDRAARARVGAHDAR